MCYCLSRYGTPFTIQTARRQQPVQTVSVPDAVTEEPVVEVEEEEGNWNDLSARRLWGHDSPERPERGHDPNTSPSDQGLTPTPSHTEEEEEVKSDESEGGSTDESGQYQDNYYDLYDDEEEEVYSLSLLGLPHTGYA